MHKVPEATKNTMKRRRQIRSTAQRSVVEAIFVLTMIVAFSFTAGGQEQNSSASEILVAQDDNYVSVVFVRGDVTLIQRSLAVNPLAKGVQVNSGDVVETGRDGFVSLAFNSGQSTVNVHPDSRVVMGDIDCPGTTAKCVLKLNADGSEIHSEVIPSGAKETPVPFRPVRFRIETPYTAAAVRGPVFDFELYLPREPVVIQEALDNQ